MDLALIMLAVSVVLGAAILAFARRPAPDTRLDAVLSGQGDISGQFKAAIQAQAELQRTLDERIAALDKRLGENLTDSATRPPPASPASASGWCDRRSAENISALSGQVVSLQQVLSNKQSRGAFGQAQMEEIVRDGLPTSLYDFQFTLSNRNRPDCIIRMPGNAALLVIDSKFPLEGFHGLRHAATDEDKKAALAQVRTSVTKHFTDIAEKYLIPGEVQTPAIMFVPSESIYADLHDGFSDVIQKAHRANVIVVSPNILMLAINTIQTVMKDARMREQADLIRQEVGVLLNDVRLLSDRVSKLQSHFNQADADIKNILISTSKITTGRKRSKRSNWPRRRLQKPDLN